MPVEQVDKLVRVTFAFGLFEGSAQQEVAEPSVYFRAGAVPSDPAVTNAILNDMATAALASLVANVDTANHSATVQALHCRVALEDTAGHTLFEKIVAAAGALAWQGTGAAACLPWSSSLVISLYGYTPGEFDPFGKSKRGRMYLPPFATTVMHNDGTGKLAIALCGDLVDQWGQVLQELQQHDYSGFPTFSPVLVINSRRQVQAFPVTHLRVDNKLDTQRRRERQQLFDLATAPYPHS